MATHFGFLMLCREGGKSVESVSSAEVFDQEWKAEKRCGS